MTDNQRYIYNLVRDHHYKYEEAEELVKILCSAEANCDVHEACHLLAMGTTVYEADDITRHLESYLNYWCIGDEDEIEDKKNAIRNMIAGGECATDWGRTEYNGNLYYIEYAY